MRILAVSGSLREGSMPQPLLVCEAGCMPIGEGGLPSGIFAGATYDSHAIQLQPGDAVLFASDGLHELRDRYDKDFSWQRLQDIWLQCGRSYWR